ncbi:MAG TPA: YdcH family protein [Blastocatellia bacterium]|nr:YdcH family protein [Blastocatellia bacterium]
MNQFSTTEELKDYLLSSDPHFRELVDEHKQYEQRLSELSALPYPNDDELNEEKSIKKKKLYIKDQMEMILHQYRHRESA